LLRTLTPEEAAFVNGSAENYAKLAMAHKIEAQKVGRRGVGAERQGVQVYWEEGGTVRVGAL
jgi:hypothetical protein